MRRTCTWALLAVAVVACDDSGSGGANLGTDSEADASGRAADVDGGDSEAATDAAKGDVDGSCSTNSSTQIRAWSPLYGDQLGGPVDNDFTYDWYAMDWSGHLHPSDSPGLTAVQIYAQGGSGSLAVAEMELCVQ